MIKITDVDEWIDSKLLRGAFSFLSLALVSFFLSVFFSEGVDEIFSLLGIEMTTTRFLTFLTTILIFNNIILIVWGRGKINEFSDRIDDYALALKEESRTSIKQNTKEAVQTEVIDSLLPNDFERGLIQRKVVPELRRLLELIDHPEPLQRGYFYILQKEINEVQDSLENVPEPGINVDVHEHNRISEEMLTDGGEYIQIQRKAFDVNDEWTRSFKRFIKTKPNSESEYILLSSEEHLREQMEKVETMREFFDGEKCTFKICNKEIIERQMEIPNDDVIEIFKGEYVKISNSPEIYEDETVVKLRLKLLSDERDLNRFVRSVRNSAERPSDDPKYAFKEN